jgi:hypothetical protein
MGLPGAYLFYTAFFAAETFLFYVINRLISYVHASVAAETITLAFIDTQEKVRKHSGIVGSHMYLDSAIWASSLPYETQPPGNAPPHPTQKQPSCLVSDTWHTQEKYLNRLEAKYR